MANRTEEIEQIARAIAASRTPNQAPVKAKKGQGPNLARLLRELKDIQRATGSKPELKPPDENGVRWAYVGQNSSHSFYIGVDGEDRIWTRSFGPTTFDREAYEAAVEEAKGTGKFILMSEFEENDYSESRLVPDWKDIGYIGHL